MKSGGRACRILALLVGLLLALVLVAPGAWASDLELAVGQGTADSGETLQLPVNLTSTGQVVMLQFDISYDQGLLSLQAVELGSGLKSTHSMVANQVGDKQRIMIYNTSLQPIPQGLQTLVTLIFVVAPNAQPGQECVLELVNVVIADPGNNDLSNQVELTAGRFSVPGRATTADSNSGNSTTKPASSLPNQPTTTVIPVLPTTSNPGDIPGVGNPAASTTGSSLNQVHLADTGGHWAEAQIRQLVSGGAINGYPDGTFKPDNPVTRAEFVKVLVGLLDLEVQNGRVFADTAGHWARDYIDRAASSGLISGYEDNRFGPDDPLTREQMAAIMVNALGLTIMSEDLVFSDRDQVSSWARAVVAAARDHGLLSGYPDGSFRPQASATRAEAVSVMVSALRSGGKKSP